MGTISGLVFTVKTTPDEQLELQPFGKFFDIDRGTEDD